MYKIRIITIALLFMSSQYLYSADSRNNYIWLDSQNRSFSDKYIILPSKMEYPRDSSFPLLHLPSKAQYIPRPMTQSDADAKLYLLDVVLTGYYMDEYGSDCGKAKSYLFDSGARGKGFVDKYLIIKEYFDNNNIAYNRPGKTIIEGGNIHFVDSSHDNKMAIIGDHTLWINHLTMDKNWVDETELKDRGALLYTVRNFLTAVAKMTAGEGWRLLENNRDMFLETLSNEPTQKYESGVKNFDISINWIEKQIAQEISLPRENIIYIPQRMFHIDLDMTFTADNKILLRAPVDENEAAIYKLQLDILTQKFPDQVIEAPAQFSDPYIFCGIVSPNTTWYYFTAQVSNLDADFANFLKEECNFTQVAPLTTSYWQDLKKKHAGLHCVTQEYYKNPSVCANACAVCASQEKLSRCSRCKTVFYCGADCQRKDWPKHKDICQLKK